MGRGKGVLRSLGGDDGGAIVEFIGMSLLLLVPLVYLVVAFSRVQAGIYAAELAAGDAARGAVVAAVSELDDGASRSAAMAAADRRATGAVALVVGDFGFESDDAGLVLTCHPMPCFAPGSDVVASVEIEVALPGMPSFLRSWLPLEVLVTAESASPVDAFTGGR